MRYDLVSFDLDGTLVDTAAEIAEAACRALEEHGIARRPVPEIVGFIGHGTRELILRLLGRVFEEQPGLAASVPVDRVQQSMDHHYALTTGTTAAPYPGAVAALRRLGAAGVKVACVTNKEARHAHRVLEVTGLAGFFALTIGGDTLPHKKPDARVLRYVVQVLGGELSRSAHVGDSAIDVQAARNAGVAAWAVPYGYNGGAPITAADPDRVFPGLLDVADFALGVTPRA
ncbi:MAG: HAD-IA family hydrolase [Gemmatimonadetes bacterium]|nr:HAD-IA family hydrolase [Gemmatimonadota bacterium]MBK7349555.1 HAD-IA family hydrolase [Gemmatimonadota bacterium]MBK7715958.1 HAD-IA family hydrolase [Gemmatimonadota bacterium]MBK7784185.1 HAD-IA family hydrolase [Gemmatimonadota bacterium]MBK9067769.1 HAD-IA family hydrolase [Gemmatimonadota bacterium]